MAHRGCAHLNAIITVKHAKKRECEECVKTGDSWVHLRHVSRVRPDAVLRQLAESTRLAAREGERSSGDRIR